MENYKGIVENCHTLIKSLEIKNKIKKFSGFVILLPIIQAE